MDTSILTKGAQLRKIANYCLPARATRHLPRGPNGKARRATQLKGVAA
jgi:hypothetical protein